MLKNHLKSDNTRINNNFVQILTSLIKFILDCNTLTRLETSSSWVHCSNEAEMGRSSWGSDDSKWLLLGALRVGIPVVPGVLGCAGAPEVFKIPGSVTKRIFPPNSFLLWGIKATTRFLGQGRRKGKGAVANRYPP